MICPKCKKAQTRVLDSRDTDNKKAIRRRRECEDCKYRFTTFERTETTNFIIVKKDGSRENYDREKVLKGIWIACQRRKISEEQLNIFVNNLEEKWSLKGKELPSTEIGEDIMNGLKKIDEVAYIRFASVYQDFNDLETFHLELEKLKNK